MAERQTWQITLDQLPVSAKERQTILEVALEHHIDIPHICYHETLGPIQTCDTCIVEVNGELVRACDTFVQPHMEVHITQKQAHAARIEAMDRILHNHELYCTVCDNNNGNCVVHNTTEQLQVEHQKYPFNEKPYQEDHSNPFYRYDPDQCILCGRCVEACQNIQVTETLSIAWDRERPRVIWDDDVPIDMSSCVSCGHCVTVCPCNALMEKSMLGEAGYLTGIKPELLHPMIELTKKIEPGYGPIFAVSNAESAMRKARIKRTKTVCTYCGVGCSFDIWTKDRQILKIEPTPEAPVNGISTCIKGKFGWQFVNSKDRLTKPLIRRDDLFYEATWEEALDLITTKLTAIKEQHGPDALAFIASSKCTNEENYLMQKLARSVFGTNNVDNCSRYCQSPATTGLFRTVGYGGDSGSIHDLEIAELILIVGANPAESHPVLATKIKRAHKLFGQKLIVADLRKNEMAKRADLHLHPNPSTDLIWLSAVTKYIIDNGWEDREFIAKRVNGYAEFVESLEPYTLDYAEKMTGIPRSQLIQTANMIHAANGVCILWAMGVTQHCGGSDTSTAISNLLLITGNYGKKGTGAYPLRGHNNVQGASDFGTMPAWFPGYQEVQNDEIRARFERAWGTPLSKVPGYDNHQMVDGIHEGKVKAMYLFGEEMAFVDSNANHVHAAFEKLEFFIVQDIFFSKTAQFADVVLPASPSLEKEGTFTNTERRLQRFYQVFEPLGESKPDWQIIMAIANRMGANWTYQHPSDIMAEAAKLTPLFAGVTYERLEGYDSLQWPVAQDGTDTKLLYTERFHFPDGKAQLYPVEYTPPIELAEEYDLHLNNGRLLEHFHEGNMTYRVDGITHKVPSTFIEISKELARARELKDGALVRLISPYGRIEVRVAITDRVAGKEIYLPMNTREDAEAVNYLTSSYHDLATHTPAYKEMSVRMEILESAGDSPIPKHNWRHATAKSRPGVEVIKKWQRNDYIPLTTAGLQGEDKPWQKQAPHF
ncbi:formate dehydrogenase subunit alpha [Sulfoacidibacillus thermotolerans]|uniref:Formate dehydrogenase subunit alpha n=1 Tax=Sulfoacidibacillus thermotolerans TaxID=1765684 RepID=A0A2U3DBV8_SULT2|nr:formate dehydrogenase subunit alpha [Sulfoacidibacillus thermotolerans]PWI58767.1 formate dehydrogenase subunit alpha [Sulfoacidibacillus thermotolerans]